MEWTWLHYSLAGYGVVVLFLTADVWRSQLSSLARTLWTAMLVFLAILGPIAWLITRASAHQPLSDFAE